jgi:hypothetical protein
METEEVFEFDQPSTTVHSGKPFERPVFSRVFTGRQITRLTRLLEPLVQLSMFRRLNIVVS